MDVLERLADLPLPVVLLLVGVLAFSETGIGFGFVLPGETGVLVLATTVSTPGLFVAMTLVVWLSAVAGDSFGYWVGRRWGTQVPDTRLGRRLGREKWDRAEHLLDHYGARTVVLSRFLPAVRVLTPVVAGTVRLSYRRFLAASAAGALVWAAAHVAAGALAGASLRAVEEAIGWGSWVLLAVVAVAVAVWALRRRRSRDDAGARGSTRAQVRA